MKTEDVIAQLLIMGFCDVAINDKSDIARDLKKYRLGGVILFDKQNDDGLLKRNIESPLQLKQLTHDLKMLQSDLFIAIDQEGGQVARLDPALGFPAFPTPAAIGKKQDYSFTRRCAENMASVLFDLGVNINFFPTVDVAITPDNPIIAKMERSFSDNPMEVVEHAAIFIDAFEKQNIHSCLKHFPGHGSSRNDSHLGFTDVTETWLPSELIPYQRLFKKGYRGLVMLAHVFHQQWANPASLSPHVATTLLRNELGFSGVAIADDLHMLAIKNDYSPEEAILLALNAGCDMLIFGNNIGVFEENLIEKNIEIIKRLLNKNYLSETRLWEAYQRVQQLKSLG